eukprot:GHVU01048130.1.p1 GENE.GHVU01048130.1~~GHVU01048130.1.p1  ORF type:complete len:156 (-),score=8.99 GHVU01048130.1:341-808(-)
MHPQKKSPISSVLLLELCDRLIIVIDIPPRGAAAAVIVSHSLTHLTTLKSHHHRHPRTPPHPVTPTRSGSGKRKTSYYEYMPNESFKETTRKRYIYMTSPTAAPRLAPGQTGKQANGETHDHSDACLLTPLPTDIYLFAYISIRCCLVEYFVPFI